MVAALLQDRRIPTSILRIAVPDRIVPHGAPNLLHAKYGLDSDGIVERVHKFANEFPARPSAKQRSVLQPY
jgi:deoxyxylulose-5-phosphate synthase